MTIKLAMNYTTSCKATLDSMDMLSVFEMQILISNLRGFIGESTIGQILKLGAEGG